MDERTASPTCLCELSREAVSHAALSLLCPSFARLSSFAEISVRVSVRIRLCTLFPWRYIMKAVFHHVFMWLHRTAECLDRSQPLSVCVWKPAIMSPGWRSDGVFRVGLSGWIWIVSQMSSWINTAIYFKLQSDCTLNCLLFCFPPPAVSLIVISASYPPLAA